MLIFDSQPRYPTGYVFCEGITVNEQRASSLATARANVGEGRRAAPTSPTSDVLINGGGRGGGNEEARCHGEGGGGGSDDGGYVGGDGGGGGSCGPSAGRRR